MDLFAPPRSLTRINQLLSAEPVDLRRLGEAVAENSGVAAEALRLCNSSVFGLCPQAISVEQAVVSLDAEIVRSLLLTCWLTRYSAAHVQARENRIFWRHSLLVAQLSRRLAEWLNFAAPEKVFLAGLLHDAGNLPFLSFFSRTGPPGHEGIYQEVGDSVDLQRRRFGNDHCELGEKMVSILGLPPYIADAVERHHQRAEPDTTLTPFIYAAEMISLRHKEMSIGAGLAAPQSRLIHAVLEECFPGFGGPGFGGLVDVLDAELQTASLPFARATGSFWEPGLSPSVVP
ncbi:MAG: HDOD domain-containing protein [Acidobacteriota bacterium]|nr:HDOD domain-containing protein [Acidobacteriota bacterium]